MTVHARIPASEMNDASGLYRDFVSGTRAKIHEWIASPAADARAWQAALASPVKLNAALVEAVGARSRELDVDAGVISQLGGLVDGSARAVVTGQQPGVVGGPLMGLYKGAAAVALARRIESMTGHACIPIFWLGADDDDFAEVRDLSVLATDCARIDAAVDASAYRPGLRVGDIDGAAVRAVWNAVMPVAPAGRGRDAVSAALDQATDFADASARLLVAATGGKMAVVDGRSAALRVAGRDLLLNFFDREARLRELLLEDGKALEAEGYHAQVQWGTDSGLFVVQGGVRQRVPAQRRDEARAMFERDITCVSPGVVARNLLQDGLFVPAAVVLGPAEIAYRAQMVRVYEQMGVPMPRVMPRLSATYLPPAVEEMVRELGLDAAALARDPGGTASLALSRAPDDALRKAASALEADFARSTASFSASAAARLDERSRQKLQKRIDDLAGRLAQTLSAALEQDVNGPRARWPFLGRMEDIFRKDSVAQERFLSLVTPGLFHGEAAWEAIAGMANDWTGDALDGRVWHGVYSV